MKTTILAVFAAIGLAVAIAPAAHAFTKGFPHPTQHQGPYDNTAAAEQAPNISSSDAPGG